MNGLSEPTVSGTDPALPLTSPDGLAAGSWLSGDDPAGEQVVRYLVECALPADEVIEVADGAFTFEGKLGLAPEWKDHACDEDCQQWVSACLLARTNESGAEVPIFTVGAHEALGFGARPDFPYREGTFFGNAFASPPRMYVCQGTFAGLSKAAAQDRTCAQDEDSCGFTVLSGCTDSPPHTSKFQAEPDGPGYHGITVHVGRPE